MQISYKTEVKEYTLTIADSKAKIVNKPDIVFNILKDDFNPFQEELYLLILNNANTVISKHLIGKGCLNSTVITTAEIFRMIFLTNGNNFILAHNHPSNDVTESEEDIIFTNKISGASKICGLNFLDHIIFSADNYNSLRTKRIL